MNIFLDIWHLWCQILQPKHAKTPRQNSHKDETRSSHLSQENFLQPCGLHNLETWKPKQSKTLKLKSVSKHISYQSIFTSFHAQLGTQLGTQKHTGTPIPPGHVQWSSYWWEEGCRSQSIWETDQGNARADATWFQLVQHPGKITKNPDFLEVTGIFVSQKIQIFFQNDARMKVKIL